MTYNSRDQAYLVGDQYRNASNLQARIQIYDFSDNPYSFHRWLFDRYVLPPDARLLEVGCGSAKLWLDNQDRIPPGWEITVTDLSPGMVEEARASLCGVNRPFAFQVMDAQSIQDADGSFTAW